MAAAARPDGLLRALPPRARRHLRPRHRGEQALLRVLARGGPEPVGAAGARREQGPRRFRAAGPQGAGRALRRPAHAATRPVLERRRRAVPRERRPGHRGAARRARRCRGGRALRVDAAPQPPRRARVVGGNRRRHERVARSGDPLAGSSRQLRLVRASAARAVGRADAQARRAACARDARRRVPRDRRASGRASVDGARPLRPHP